MVLRTSAKLQCSYCTNTHTVVSIQAGLTPDEILALRGEKNIEEVFSDEKERLLIVWIDAMSDGSNTIPTSLKEQMKQHYSEAEIVEFSLCIGATIMLNRYASALSLPVDPEHILMLNEHGFSIVS